MNNRALNTVTLVFLILCVSASASASDWSLRLGLHDLYVDKAQSHTRGLNAGVIFDHQWKSGYSLYFSFDLLVDNDKDELDPDHVPVWAMGKLYGNKKAVGWGKNSSLNWYLDGSGKRNTVSSIEKTVKLMPGIKTDFNGKNAYAGIMLVAGYYMFEIDDDVPELFGYTRETLNNTVFAFSLGADGRIDLGRLWALYGSAQVWRDSSEWLETQYHFEVRFDSTALIKGSRIVLHAEYAKWTLDPYANMPLDDPDYIPVLPWNSDRFVRLSIEIPLGKK